MNEHHRLAQAILNARVRSILDEAVRPNPLVEIMRVPSAPRTRWERTRDRLAVYWERITTAWRVLRGDDIHENCW